jgi:hypothetical protein
MWDFNRKLSDMEEWKLWVSSGEMEGENGRTRKYLWNVVLSIPLNVWHPRPNQNYLA